ncbi:MAG: winged helix-turn-helix domain-containing protein [Pseudomonadota bacterium]
MPLEGRFERAGEVRRVQPKSMDVLLCLAEAQGELVERDEILRRIWGERWVSDEPLTRCIGELRRALGDRRGDPDYILTVPKRGYRLLPAALAVPQAGGESPAKPEHPPLTVRQRQRRSLTLKRLGLGLFVIILVALLQVGIQRLFDRPQHTTAASRGGSSVIPVPALDARAIAVLPFADLSAMGDQAYMSDGIAEEVLNVLTKVRDLRVISRSSSFSFSGRGVDIPTVARRFNVANVLEGSVRVAGNRIRVTAQLVDARSETSVWSETFDRELTDVFAIQEEIAAAVVGKLEGSLVPGAAAVRETDPQAYALFLQARYLHEQPGGDSLGRARDLYEAAVAIDDTYLPAWVWLAALYDDTVNSGDLPRDEILRRMFAAIDRALEIAPDDPLALGMSAVLQERWRDDLVTSSSQMQRALELDPSNPILLRWAVIAMHGLGQHRDAVEVAEYLFARDPVGNISRINLAGSYLLAGRFEEAVEMCEIQVATATTTGPCRSSLATAYLYAGNPKAAKAQLEMMAGSRRHVRLAPMVFHALGDAEAFDAALAALHQTYEDGDTGLAYWIARTYTFINDTDRAFEWLYRAHEEGVLSLTHSSAYFAHLHGDPRWPQLLGDIGRRPEDVANLTLTVRLP